VSGFQVRPHELEGVLIRLGMAFRHWRERAEDERKKSA
jgi:hypothetical protein